METEAATPEEARASLVEQAKSRLTAVEEKIDGMDQQLVSAFAHVEQELNNMLDTITILATANVRQREALTALIDDPSNPNLAAKKAREILEAPFDLDTLTGRDAVAGEPEGDSPADS